MIYVIDRSYYLQLVTYNLCKMKLEYILSSYLRKLSIEKLQKSN